MTYRAFLLPLLVVGFFVLATNQSFAQEKRKKKQKLRRQTQTIKTEKNRLKT